MPSLSTIIEKATPTTIDAAREVASEIFNSDVDMGVSKAHTDWSEILDEKIKEFCDLCMELLIYVDFNEIWLRIACFLVFFNPLLLNMVARSEYKNNTLSRMIGNSKNACQFFTFILFVFGLLRNTVFVFALFLQPECELLENIYIKIFGYLCLGFGQMLVFRTAISEPALKDTVLGDYFALPRSARFQLYPLSISNSNMYQGATLSYLGIGLISAKPAGILVSFLSSSVYQGALKLEEQFANLVDARNKKKSSKKTN